MIREPSHEITEIKLDGKIGSQKISFILDTGARRNYISKKLATNCNLKWEKHDAQLDIQLANGTISAAQGVIKARIQLNDFPAFTFDETLVVLESSLDEVLLGIPFLNNQGVLIDFCEAKLRIVDQVIFLQNEAREWESNPDSRLASKAYTVQILATKKRF